MRKTFVSAATVLPAFVLSALALSGCATTSPERICSAEWIGARADRALDAIERDTTRAMISLRKVGESYADGREPNVLALLNLRRTLSDLEDELTDGRGVRDLRTLATTCDDPQLVAHGLDRWLVSQDLPAVLTTLVRDSGLMERLVQAASR